MAAASRPAEAGVVGTLVAAGAIAGGIAAVVSLLVLIPRSLGKIARGLVTYSELPARVGALEVAMTALVEQVTQLVARMDRTGGGGG